MLTYFTSLNTGNPPFSSLENTNFPFTFTSNDAVNGKVNGKENCHDIEVQAEF